MFDLITGQAAHTPRNQTVPILVATAAHVMVVGLLVVLPLLYVTDQLPEMPTMMAFVEGGVDGGVPGGVAGGVVGGLPDAR